MLDNIEEDLGEETSRLMIGIDESTIMIKRVDSLGKKKRRTVSFSPVLNQEYPQSEDTVTDISDIGLKQIFLCRVYLILLW